MSRRKLRTVYSEAPFEDKREPDADCEQSDRCLTDPEPDMEMRQAHFRNMRSKCRCSYDLQLRDGLFPVHSPLLRESQLFSFPPLINMLKFGG